MGDVEEIWGRYRGDIATDVPRQGHQGLDTLTLILTITITIPITLILPLTLTLTLTLTLSLPRGVLRGVRLRRAHR